MGTRTSAAFLKPSRYVVALTPDLLQIIFGQLAPLLPATPNLIPGTPPFSSIQPVLPSLVFCDGGAISKAQKYFAF